MSDLAATSDEDMLAQAIALSLQSEATAVVGEDTRGPRKGEEEETVPDPPTDKCTAGTTTTLTSSRPVRAAVMHETRSSRGDQWAFSETPSSPKLTAISLDAPVEDGDVVRSKLRAHAEQWVSRRGQEWPLTTKRHGGSDAMVLPAIRLPDTDGWQPNRECLELVIGMGISENAAIRALYHTGNDDPELAVAWIFENIENSDLHKPFAPPPIGLSKKQVPQMGPVCHSLDEVEVTRETEDETPKMVFVVNSELSMGPGKMAAQVGHATLHLFRHVQEGKDEKACAEMKQWEETGGKKVVVRGNNAQHLLALKKRSYELRIPNVMVHDAGRTQVEPGSLTVLALFGRSSLLDKVTGKLRLL